MPLRRKGSRGDTGTDYTGEVRAYTQRALPLGTNALILGTLANNRQLLAGPLYIKEADYCRSSIVTHYG